MYVIKNGKEVNKGLRDFR